MFAAPDDLTEDALAEVLLGGWKIQAASMSYQPVGWGSHHWVVFGRDGVSWFVTVDELENKRVSDAESLAAGFGRLRDSLLSAVALREAGLKFVVAPGLAADGSPAVRFGGRFAAAIYPHVAGQSFAWGEWADGLQPALLDLVAQVHLAPERARRHARTEDFGVPFRELTEAALDGWEPDELGPYSRPVTQLLREYATPLRRWLVQYDALVAAARQQPDRAVLTHGEPHPGNVMLTSTGWRLIDWDTALIAPPERDLWSLVERDGAAPSRYTAATGITPLTELIELYRLRWDIADVAYDVARFFRPHAESANDVESWDLLSSLIRRSSS